MSSDTNTQENQKTNISQPKDLVNKSEKVEIVQVKNDNSNDEENDPNDPCLKKSVNVEKGKRVFREVGEDPRFQQTNQTMRCFVSYIDFFRCEKILGEGHEACGWFKDSYQTFCPLKWIQDFDEAREEGRFPWHRRNQGQFPGDKYG